MHPRQTKKPNQRWFGSTRYESWIELQPVKIAVIGFNMAWPCEVEITQQLRERNYRRMAGVVNARRRFFCPRSRASSRRDANLQAWHCGKNSKPIRIFPTKLLFPFSPGRYKPFPLVWKFGRERRAVPLGGRTRDIGEPVGSELGMRSESMPHVAFILSDRAAGFWPQLGCQQFPADKTVQDVRPIQQKATDAPRPETAAVEAAQPSMARAQALEDAQKISDAMALYEQIRRSDTTQTLAATKKMAFIYLRNNQLDRAELEYQFLLQQNPHDPDTLYGLGDIAYRRGQWGSAEKMFRDASGPEAGPHECTGQFGHDVGAARRV